MFRETHVIPINAINDYIFLEDAYYGKGGFKDGSYLIPHPRETLEKYNRRKALAYYLNYVKATINSHVDPIFRVDPARNWENGELFSIFVNDSDTMGTSFSRFMKRAAINAKILGMVLIVVDNASDQPISKADAIKKRTLPYVYFVKPRQITKYTTNSSGKLTSITYETVSSANESGILNTTWTWTSDKWERIDSNGNKSSGDHGLGRLPVVPLFSKQVDVCDIKPQSEFYNIVKANQRLYNLCSEIDEIIRSQAFSILTYPLEDKSDDVQEINISTENILGYNGMLSNQPCYISPSSDILEQLRDERKDLIEEIYRMAELSHITGVQEKNSGVAKQWDFEQTNQSLADFAKNIEEVEREISRIFELWTNESIGFSTKYSDDFGIVDVVGELDKVGKALELNIGSQFNSEAKKKAVSVFLNDIPEDRYDEVMADIEARAQDETYTFNGAQVTSAVELMINVANKQVSPETAKLMLVAFFGLDEKRAQQMVDAQKSAQPADSGGVIVDGQVG